MRLKLLLFKFFKNRFMRQSNLLPEGKLRLKQNTLFCGKGKVRFGHRVMIGFNPSPYYYSGYSHLEARLESAEIIIDDNTCINNNCQIIAEGTSIHIGKNCNIGYNFQCLDSDFHGLEVCDRDNANSVKRVPVNIGDNVFIGNNVIILKGVTIGNGAVIGAGAVVTKSIPENSIAAGNPAKVIRVLKGSAND